MKLDAMKNRVSTFTSMDSMYHSFKKRNTVYHIGTPATTGDAHVHNIGKIGRLYSDNWFRHKSYYGLIWIKKSRQKEDNLNILKPCK